MAMHGELERLRQALTVQTAECEALKAQLSVDIGSMGMLNRLHARLTFKRSSGSGSGSCSGMYDAAAPRTAFAAERTTSEGGGEALNSGCSGTDSVGSTFVLRQVQPGSRGNGSSIPLTTHTQQDDAIKVHTGAPVAGRVGLANQVGHVWRRFTTPGSMPELDVIDEDDGEGASLVRKRHCRASKSEGGVGLLSSAGAQAALQVAKSASLLEHIIRQLVRLVQQKRGEVQQQKQQEAGLRAQVAAAHLQLNAQEARHQLMVKGVARLVAARQEEFGQWSSSLKGLEVGLLEAQSESQAYRDHALALHDQLTEAKERCQEQVEQLCATSQASLQAVEALQGVQVRILCCLVFCMAHWCWDCRVRAFAGCLNHIVFVYIYTCPANNLPFGITNLFSRQRAL
jgi:hypothetical protein